MNSNKIIKYEGAIIKRVESVINIANKLLSLAQEILIPFRKVNKWGYSNCAREIIIECVYDRANLFSEQLAAVCLDGKYGYIDKQGKIIIDFQYDYAEDFYNNFAVVKKLGKKGIINKKNQIQVEIKYDDLSFRRDGYYQFKENDKVGLLNSNLIEVFPHRFSDIGIFSEEGLASVRSSDTFGYIDRTAEVVIPYSFNSAEEFKNGVTVVDVEDEFYLINIDGNRVSDIYKSLDSSQYDDQDLYRCSKDDLYFGFIDKFGNQIIPLEYDDVGNFNEGLAWFCKDGKVGYIDKLNSVVINPQYADASDFCDGLAIVELDGKQGLINRKAETLIPFTYDYISFDVLQNNNFEVELENKHGIINGSGEILVSLKYSNIYSTSEIGFFATFFNDSEFQFFSNTGVEYWED